MRQPLNGTRQSSWIWRSEQTTESLFVFRPRDTSRPVPLLECFTWYGNLEWGKDRCNNPDLPPSTCYLVCGSKIMVVRHCCIMFYPALHSAFAIHLSFGRRCGLCLEDPAPPQPSDLAHNSCCEPYHQEPKAIDSAVDPHKNREDRRSVSREC